MLKRALICGVMVIGLGGGMPPHAAFAQTDQAQSLADIRQELSVLYFEIQRLRLELSTTGGPSLPAGTANPLSRLDAIEAELRRMTAATETLQLRIEAIVGDGTNRIGDLEFRLCELEPDCDIATLGDTPSLGGVAPSGDTGTPLGQGSTLAPAPSSGGASDGPQLAVAEQSDFDRALAAYDAGNWAEAAQAFSRFAETYPGGPLSGEAHFLRGEAEVQQGAWSRAARAFLDSFSGSPDGPRAPAALARLGQSLGELGQIEEACITLSEVATRYPEARSEIATAEATRAALACN